MANVITGKVWALDTVVGLVTDGPVNIHNMRISFTTAGAGSCILSTGLSTADEILNIKTTAASTAVVWHTTREYSFGNQTFQGLRKVLMVNVDTIQVVTGNPD